MASNILSIGKSALSAAQVGLSTTGHNIANASTPGYSRQVIVQSAAQSQNFGYGYVGQGTEISAVTRVYNEILAKQVVSSQSVSAGINAYSTQLNSIDNMLSDAAAGINPAMNDFFGSVQDLSANPSDIPTRQSMLSNAQSLVNRFQSASSRLNEIRDSINTQLTSTVSLVNTYAKQIASLNDVIDKAISATGNPPNDLMDQRDQLVLELSKQIKTTVVPQNQGSYNIFVGNGLPLVVGADTYALTTASNPTDPSRLEVAYQSKTKTTILGVDSLPGGTIGGLLQFRAESLDAVQNQLGQIALVLAETFNTQHAQGLDLNGKPGGALFTIPTPVVSSNNDNTGNAVVNSQIVDARSLTSSDYRLQFDGSNYKITRLSDKTVQSFASLPQTLDGLSFSQASGTMNAGDDFVIRPTQNAATGIKLTITDASKLAVGGPALSSATYITNTGTATISNPTAASSYSSSPMVGALGLTYNSGIPGTLTLAPSSQPVTVTSGGTSTTFPAGAAVTYTSGATITVGGLSFAISGTPTDGDQFTITPNITNGPGDNRNGLLLAGLQGQSTVQSTGSNSKISYSSAFSQLVNNVGNKTRELKVTGAAEAKVLEQATAAVQSESGVNLDEEATNLLRYQQAYQAAGKMMQIASQLFDVLLQLGR
ncbi:flagellar hook-associated protein FlgK [Methylotenera sp.]|uniref:flagellar hook-associated protein FlgK n=1 Tax=Methylotenera sp. TaxID=2051956 RepID=UPI00272FCE24|nr:flagellar hook-associated protein FlgK [Methylotenera sp.]MDP2229568.1 flagellar hook-associated protein FlgK [Methylotenera sp.]MDP3140124.1 flagellar hook-associated protein FlgK [Methylotenera sp.]